MHIDVLKRRADLGYRQMVLDNLIFNIVIALRN